MWVTYPVKTPLWAGMSRRRQTGELATDGAVPRGHAPQRREVRHIHGTSPQSRDAGPRESAQLPVRGLAAQAGEPSDELLPDFEVGGRRRAGRTGQSLEQQQEGMRHATEGVAQREHREAVEGCRGL